MLKKLMVVFVCLTILAFAATETYRVTLFQPTTVSGTTLKPGDYKLQVTDTKVVISQGKQSVQAQIRVENGDQKFGTTIVRYSNGDGQYKIQEIRLGGTKTRLVF